MQAVEYSINGMDRISKEIRVVYRGKGKWAVVQDELCMSVDGEWLYEPIPSSRTNEWLVRHRFNSAELAYDAYLKFHGESH